MRWLNSLDEILFEAMSWFVFLPLTLWRTLVRPLGMMAYADEQLALPEDERYAAAVSPPLFLALALLIAHGVSTVMGQTDYLVANQQGLAALVDDETSALLLRLVLFATFPLVMSVKLLRRRGVKIARDTLRLPFYGQCYPAAAFALTLSVGTTLRTMEGGSAHIAGAILTSLAFVYLLIVETRWFMVQLSIGPIRAFVAAFLGMIEGLVLVMLASFLFTR